jgi:hypothetical protein
VHVARSTGETPEHDTNAEARRLEEAREGMVAWKKWGPYLSERQWEELKPKLEAARQEAGKTAESVGSALSLALEELKKGYERMRKLL